MEFHEDVIFKSEGQSYGKELLEIIKIKGKILEVHQTEYSIVDPKMYKPDLVFELEDKIVILEFQSTYVDVDDKRRFRFYSAIFDHVKIKSKKPIEVHVLSTAESEKTKIYKVNPDSIFPIYIHSLKNYDGEKFLNRMKSKIESNEQLTKKELLMISLLCFMDSEKDIGHSIHDSAVTITNIKGLDKDIGQFVKGIVLMLCDKFVDNELLNKSISNLMGGNMKIVEEYAKRYAEEYAEEYAEKYAEKYAEEKIDERNEEIVINLNKKGFTIEDIAETVNVNLDFVKKTLAK